MHSEIPQKGIFRHVSVMPMQRLGQGVVDQYTYCKNDPWGRVSTRCGLHLEGQARSRFGQQSAAIMDRFPWQSNRHLCIRVHRKESPICLCLAVASVNVSLLHSKQATVSFLHLEGRPFVSPFSPMPQPKLLYINLTETDEWSSIQDNGPQPPWRGAHSASVWRDTMLVYGGMYENMHRNDLWVLDFSMFACQWVHVHALMMAGAYVRSQRNASCPRFPMFVN